VVGNLPTHGRDPDYCGPDASIRSASCRHFWQATIGRATRQSHLPGATLGTPVGYTCTRFRMELVRAITQVDQVGRFEAYCCEMHGKQS